MKRENPICSHKATTLQLCLCQSIPQAQQLQSFSLLWVARPLPLADRYQMGCSLHAAFNVLLICLAYATILLTHSNTIALCTPSLTCPTWKLRYWNMLNVSPSTFPSPPSWRENISPIDGSFRGSQIGNIRSPHRLNDFYYYNSITPWANQSYELGNISKPWIKWKGGLEDVFFSFYVKCKKKGTKKVGLLRSEWVCHGEKLAKQTFEIHSCEINEQRKCHVQQRGLRPADSLNFLVSLNKRSFVHHSVDYRGSNYLDLKMLSASNGSTQIFHSKSFGGWEPVIKSNFSFQPSS